MNKKQENILESIKNSTEYKLNLIHIRCDDDNIYITDASKSANTFHATRIILILEANRVPNFIKILDGKLTLCIFGYE